MAPATSGTLPCRSTNKPAGDIDQCLIEACNAFQDTVTSFGRNVSALDGLDVASPSEGDIEGLQASIRQLHAEWRTIAWDIIEMPTDCPAGTQAKVDALSAYFLHVDDFIECIGLDLARSLVADLKRPGNR